MEPFYFKKQQDPECSVYNVPFMQMQCIKCKFNFGFNLNDNWIKCKIYSTYLEFDQLTIENKKLKIEIEQLKNNILSNEIEIFYLNGGK